MLPAWMLDAGRCAAMTYGSHRAEISSLLELRAQLAVLGFDHGACPTGKEERHESTAATTFTAGAVEPATSADRHRELRATGRPESARRDPPRRRRRRVAGTGGRR